MTDKPGKPPKANAEQPAANSRSDLSEQELQAYLDGDTELSQAYRNMDSPEPPAALDRAILEQARAATTKQLAAKAKSWLDLDLEFWRRWARPLSTVVIMGVSLAVVLQVMDNSVYKMEATTTSGQTESVDVMQETEQAYLRKRAMITRDKAARPNAAQLTIPMDSIAPAASPEQAESYMQQRADSDNMQGRQQQPESADAEARQQTFGKEELRALEQSPAREEKLADAAMEADAALYAAAPATTAAQKAAKAAAPEPLLADDALQAWNAGAKPAAEVWLAGIEAVHGSKLSPALAREMSKFAAVYPEEAALYQQAHAYTPADLADYLDATAVDATAEPATLADLPARQLPAPDVWSAGINRLYGIGTVDDGMDRADKGAAEREKFKRIYPEYQ